jgi:hypothetical protein
MIPFITTAVKTSKPTYLLEIPRLLGRKYGCIENPRILFLKRLSNNNRNISCESSFFPLHVGKSHVMTAIDRNAILID